MEISSPKIGFKNQSRDRDPVYKIRKISSKLKIHFLLMSNLTYAKFRLSNNFNYLIAVLHVIVFKFPLENVSIKGGSRPGSNFAFKMTGELV